MRNKQHSLCFTGHRSEKLPKGRKLMLLRRRILVEINLAILMGYNTFYTGMAHGWDLICGELVVQRKQMAAANGEPPLFLICVIPFPAQVNEYSQQDQQLYHALLKEADIVIYLAQSFDKTVYKKRNQYLVDHSNYVIAYNNNPNLRTGTGQTMRMAAKANIPIRNLFDPQNKLFSKMYP